jgi:hypothetical protein
VAHKAQYLGLENTDMGFALSRQRRHLTCLQCKGYFRGAGSGLGTVRVPSGVQFKAAG